FFFQAEDGIRDRNVTGVQTCALPISLGFIAVEAGWTVTEVGRQPWIIYGIMKTEDALSPMPGLQYSFYMITALYLLLTAIVTWRSEERRVGKEARARWETCTEEKRGR